MVGVAQRKSGGLQNRVSRGFESRPDLQGRICPIVARSGNLLIYPKLTAGKDRPPGLSHARRLYGTVAQMVEQLHYGLVHRLHRAVRRRFESGLSHQCQSHVWCMARGLCPARTARSG